MHKGDGNRDGKPVMPANHHLTCSTLFADGVEESRCRRCRLS
jgi:hypothetical protein